MSIKETLERLDEKFLTNPRSRMCYLSGYEKRELVKFVEEEIKLAMEEVKLEHKTFPEIESDDFDKGYNKAVENFNSNISKYFEV